MTANTEEILFMTDVLIKENRAVYSFREFYWIKNLIGENIDLNHFFKRL